MLRTFFRRRQCWVPTLLGWALIGLVVTAVGAAYVSGVHAFLAWSEPLRTRTLVLEEWVSSTVSLRLAAEEFMAHDYARMVILEDQERPWVIPMLKRNGMPGDGIVTIPVKVARKDRTYSSAAALKDWLASVGVEDNAVDIFTIGTHARRSWVLFRKALAPEFRVGIISSPSPSYDPEHWWQSSEGFKEVVYETIACTYTYLVFLPFH